MKSYNKKIEIIFSLILFCGLFVFAKNSQAATLYISPTGNDTNAGTSAAPFKTIQKAANIVNPGDTVIVKDGVYADTNGDKYVVNITRSGTYSNWITFKSENKWGAILDGQHVTGSFGVNFTSTGNYVRFENFYVTQNSVAFWSNAAAHHVDIYGNKIYDNQGLGSFQGNGTSYHTWDSNIFYNNGYDKPVNMGHNLYLKGHHNTVINNIFHSLANGWHIQILSSTTAGDGDGWNIINNTFEGRVPNQVDQYGHIILWNEPGAPQSLTNVVIENNISYGGYQAFVEFYGAGTAQATFKNNLIDAYSQDNLYKIFNCTPNIVQTGNIIGQDPKFVDLANKNFHLQSISPAIAKGLLIGAPTYDFDGVARGSIIDIGAYEYVSGDTASPAIPKGLVVN